MGRRLLELPSASPLGHSSGSVRGRAALLAPGGPALSAEHHAVRLLPLSNQPNMSHAPDEAAAIDRRVHVGFAAAAEYLGISQKTLERKIIGAGLLPWYDFSGSRRIRRSDLITFAEAHRMIGPRGAAAR